MSTGHALTKIINPPIINSSQYRHWARVTMHLLSPDHARKTDCVVTRPLSLGRYGPSGGNMSLLFHIFFVIVIPSIQCPSSTKPGCPPPVAEFVDVRKSVRIPKISQTKVGTLTVRENSYFGKTRCSLLQDMNDPKGMIYRSSGWKKDYP